MISSGTSYATSMRPFRSHFHWWDWQQVLAWSKQTSNEAIFVSDVAASRDRLHLTTLTIHVGELYGASQIPTESNSSPSHYQRQPRLTSNSPFITTPISSIHIHASSDQQQPLAPFARVHQFHRVAFSIADGGLIGVRPTSANGTKKKIQRARWRSVAWPPRKVTGSTSVGFHSVCWFTCDLTKWLQNAMAPDEEATSRSRRVQKEKKKKEQK